MRVLLPVIVALVFAAPAGAVTPQQKQINVLKRQVSVLTIQVRALQQQEAQLQDKVTCNFAVDQDDLNLVWHTVNVIAQYLGFQSQPDFPRYDDGGACARLGVTRIR